MQSRSSTGYFPRFRGYPGRIARLMTLLSGKRQAPDGTPLGLRPPAAARPLGYEGAARRHAAHYRRMRCGG